MIADPLDLVLAVHAPDRLDDAGRKRARTVLDRLMATPAWAIQVELAEITRVTAWLPQAPTGPRYDLVGVRQPSGGATCLGLRLRCHERAPHYRTAFAHRLAACVALDHRLLPEIPGCDPGAGLVWVRMARWTGSAEQLTVAEACLHAAARLSL